MLYNFIRDDEIFSISGVDSSDSVAEGEGVSATTPATDRQLREELLAQRKLITKLEQDLSNQIKVWLWALIHLIVWAVA